MKNKKVWFITGGQHLYGTDAFAEMNAHSEEIAAYLDKFLPVGVVSKGLVTLPDEIANVFKAANEADDCIGVITWMHVFSPSKMWISGLNLLQKPLLHLHTQYNCEIPWDTIDMDFMNLNQSAHGDREHGFIATRMGLNRKVVAGYWKNKEVVSEVESWARAAAGYAFSKSLKVARFGDNMRYVAVTEGDKVEAEIKFGWQVNGYGVGDLTDVIATVTDEEVDAQMKVYSERYEMNTDNIEAVREQALYEVGMKKFLDEGGFKAFTNTFEDLHNLNQLPGLATQDLLYDGYGFGAEGDWKTSALTAIMKYMAQGRDGATVFMEDYTYHLEEGNEMALGAHMLEVCPSIAANKPKIEVHPLGIGGKNPPARLVFDSKPGEAVAATIIDMGNRFRMIVSTMEVVKNEHKMPKLPVASVLWKPHPDLKTSAECWIYAGGAHHTCLSTALTVDELRDFAKMCDIEFILIDENANVDALQKELLYNDIIYKLK
jgi:L-arabinose isomerase